VWLTTPPDPLGQDGRPAHDEGQAEVCLGEAGVGDILLWVVVLHDAGETQDGESNERSELGAVEVEVRPHDVVL
jgi:hypothetical protein